MTELLDEPIKDPDKYKPCYNCNEINYTKYKYTWWGGLLGPKLLDHVRCNSCRKTYNGKTGLSNSRAIVIYWIALLGIVLLFILLFI
ncbi:MAG: hypothetical protein MK207_00085 [Saprospiraceae bacterium]|nr:hypothetical protein [Saprospiraceae bacterium]